MNKYADANNNISFESFKKILLEEHSHVSLIYN